MDLYVERQYLEQIKGGEMRQFLQLYDANFADVYRYVARRVSGHEEIEKIIRLTFLDGLGQAQNAPTDTSFVVWLYGLAKPRVWEHIAKASVPEKQGLISVSEAQGDTGDVVERASKMMNKLSLEEREILRLKFFEEVTDGDVMTILEIEEGKVGPKIYRVLKRAHLLLFGESEEKQGVYFGELSAFFERLRGLIRIDIPEVLKLTLKTDIGKRIDRKDFAIDAQVVDSDSDLKVEKKPFKVREEGVGSEDPAKIFVEAVEEQKEEEIVRVERREAVYDFIDRWKAVLVLIPAVLFVWVAAYVFMNVFDFVSRLDRGYPTACEIDVEFEGEFYSGLKRSVNRGVSNRLCDYFEVESLLISHVEDGSMEVHVDVPDWILEYRFVDVLGDWQIQKYAKTPDSNEQSREV